MSETPNSAQTSMTRSGIDCSCPGLVKFCCVRIIYHTMTKNSSQTRSRPKRFPCSPKWEGFGASMGQEWEGLLGTLSWEGYGSSLPMGRVGKGFQEMYGKQLGRHIGPGWEAFGRDFRSCMKSLWEVLSFASASYALAENYVQPEPFLAGLWQPRPRQPEHKSHQMHTRHHPGEHGSSLGPSREDALSFPKEQQVSGAVWDC